MSERNPRDRVVNNDSIRRDRMTGGDAPEPAASTAVAQDGGTARAAPSSSNDKTAARDFGEETEEASPTFDFATAFPSEQEQSGPATVGDVLRQRRTEYGLVLDDIEADLCIRKSYVQAIEAGQYDRLPAATYAVGFVRAYAELVDLDATEMVRRFKKEALGVETPAVVEPRKRSLIAKVSRSSAARTVQRKPKIQSASPGSSETRESADVPRAARTQAHIDVPSPPATHEPRVDLPPPRARPERATFREDKPRPQKTGQRRARGVVTAAVVLIAATGAWAILSLEPINRDDRAITTVTETNSPSPDELPGPSGGSSTVPAEVTPAFVPSNTNTGTSGVEQGAPAPIMTGTLEFVGPERNAANGATEAEREILVTAPGPVAGDGAVVSGSAEAVIPGSEQKSARVPQAESGPANELGGTGGQDAVETAAMPALPPDQVAAQVPDREVMSEPLETIVIQAPTEPVESQVSKNIYGAVTDQSRVSFTASSPTQVRIHSTTGEVLFEGVLRPGDRYRVPDRHGLLLMTDSAGALKITVDGATVPSIGPRGATRENVYLNPMLLREGRAAPQ